MANLSSTMVDLSKLASALGITVEQLIAAQQTAAPDKSALVREMKYLKDQYDKSLLSFIKAEEVYLKATLDRQVAEKKFEDVALVAKNQGLEVTDLDKRITVALKKKLLGQEEAAEELKEEPKKEEAKPAPILRKTAG